MCLFISSKLKISGFKLTKALLWGILLASKFEIGASNCPDLAFGQSDQISPDMT